MTKDEEIKMLGEYLLKLLSEQKDEKTIEEGSQTRKLSLAEVAAQKTMRELKEAYGVDADHIRAIIKRANELGSNKSKGGSGRKSDHTTRWDKPLWSEFGDLLD